MKFQVCTILILTLELTQCFGNPDEPVEPTTTTTTGTVKGKVVKVSDRYVLAFLGIPYAEPPVGNNRFKKPNPVKPWQKILDATNKPPPCMQITSKSYPWVDMSEPSEDCLFLNIWVPEKLCNLRSSNKHSSNHLPIMIWIHGGGFWSGSSALNDTDGAVLAAYGNVIVVSMNYRVGFFGYFYSATPDAPGNMGLHDQNLAIQWIKKNAESFCGNANSITLFGESAGSYSVGLHMISPMSRNLFNRAIMQSGSPFHPMMALDPELVKQKDNQFATVLGCANEKANLINDPKNVIACLRNLDAEDIIKAESAVLERTPYSFIPIHGDDFMPKAPPVSILSGDFKQTDILIGNNKDEGSVFLNYAMPEIFTPQYAPDLSLAEARKIIENLFHQNQIPNTKEIADFYLNNITEGDHKTILKAVHDSLGDYLFYCPSVYLAEKVAEKNDVYYYFFTHRSSSSIWGEWVGVGHYDDVPFVFGVPCKQKEAYSNEERNFSFDIMQKWASFARNGSPVSASGRNWPKYSAVDHKYLELNPKANEAGTGPHLESCEFWRKYLISHT